jgi:hypothetical protein
MIDLKKFPILAETAHAYATEVLILADAVGDAPVTLVEVMQDFLAVVRHPIVAGGFAVAHHGFIRGTVDVDVIAVDSTVAEITALKARGYKHESIQLPIGFLDLLTKSNKGIDFIHLNDSKFLSSLVSRTVEGKILDQPVRMVSLEDLIIMKRLSIKGRRSVKDPIDLEQLEALSFNRSYVEIWRSHFKI